MGEPANGFTPKDPTYIAPIACPECNSKSNLIRRTPTRGGGEERIFECEACNRRTTFTVLD